MDSSVPTILREGPLKVALKTAHREGAELDVQGEEGILAEVTQAPGPLLLLSGLI